MISQPDWSSPSPSGLPRSSPPAEAPGVLTRHRQALEAALRSAVPEDGAELYQALRYHMGWTDEEGNPSSGTTGKRIRPTLTLLACEAAGGATEAAMPAAVAVELVHNFSLIHDDIQDRDRERHHRPTVWALWGEPKALAAGNAMYALAFGVLLKHGRAALPPEIARRAQASLAQSCLEMVEGQYSDLEFEKRLDVTTEEYLEMTARKTGALMTCAMELGALAASAKPSVVSAFACGGRQLGQLFQVSDDVLGAWGDPSATGKATGSDIRRRKKTFPVIYAMQHASGPAAIELRRLYQESSPAEDDVQRVLELLELAGARLEAETFAVQLADRALSTLRAAGVSKSRLRDIEEITYALLSRDR